MSDLQSTSKAHDRWQFAHVTMGDLPSKPRRPITRADRLALRVANAIRLNHLTEDIAQRRREAVHIEPELGALMFRWAAEHTRPRYAALRGLGR